MMSSQGLNDLTYAEKSQRIRTTKTPEELTNIYNEWANDSFYEKVCGITKSLLSIYMLSIYITYQRSNLLCVEIKKDDCVYRQL